MVEFLKFLDIIKLEIKTLDILQINRKLPINAQQEKAMKVIKIDYAFMIEILEM